MFDAMENKIEVSHPVSERDVTDALEDFRLTMRDLATGENIADHVFPVFEGFTKNPDKKLPPEQVKVFEEKFNKILTDLKNLSQAANEIKNEWDQAQSQNDNDEVNIDDDL